MDGITLKTITAADTWTLRQSVLRPHEPIAALTYPGDSAPDSIHFGLCEPSGNLIGIASLYLESLPDQSGQGWRLRGMAVAPHVQGKGLGTKLLDRCRDHILGTSGDYLWCNARKSALKFYRNNSFQVISEQFEISGIGPHFVMKREF